MDPSAAGLAFAFSRDSHQNFEAIMADVIDPDGLEATDDYKLNRNGKIELIQKTDDKTDKLYAIDKNGKVDKGNSLTVTKDFLESKKRNERKRLNHVYFL